jgi:hypothetical protein
MAVELRYRGDLLGFHDSEALAREHAAKHHADVEDQASLTVEARRPFALVCNGNLVDTFLSASDAEKFIAARLASIRLAAVRARMTRESFVIQSD